MVNLKTQLGGLGKRFWEFIRYLMTRSFGFTGSVSLTPVLENEELTPNQCQSLYYLAMDTFYAIAANRRFDCLPTEYFEKTNQKKLEKHTEGLTFSVELPQSCHNYKELLETVAVKCGCARLALRKKPTRAREFLKISMYKVL